MKDVQKKIWSYTIGFILSLIFTFTAYILVLIHISSQHETIPHYVLIPCIFILATLQLFVQLYFFLHLGKESSPRWNLLFFISTFGAILVIVVGSTWIMYHLNYNMTPMQINQYITNQSGF